MFFNSWSDIWRNIIVGVLAYIALILLLRISGKRTLSKMNAFDLIITVALGSTFATILLSKDVALADGITALGVLIGLQYIITWLSVRSKKVRELVKGEPSLLVRDGQYLSQTMKEQRVTQEEVRSAARAQGFGTIEDVDMVVLETDGSFTVVGKTADGAGLGLGQKSNKSQAG